MGAVTSNPQIHQKMVLTQDYEKHRGTDTDPKQLVRSLSSIYTTNDGFLWNPRVE